MNKKGFTLIEVIGVVTVLSLILIVAVPSLTRTLKRNEQKKYDNYINNLTMATENYVVNKLKEGESANKSIYITLGELIDAGYIKEAIVNPETDGKLSRDTNIMVSKEIDGTYKYDVLEHYVLPDEYQPVEYIENTGTQYIDTGYKPTSNIGIDITYKAIEYSGSQYIVGSRPEGSGQNIEFAVSGSSSRSDWSLRYNNITSNGGIRNSNKWNYKFTMINDIGIWTLTDLDNSTTTTANISKGQVSATANLMLFAFNSKNIHENLIIYGCKIYDGYILTRDFIPCYKKSNNEIGLFDLVTYEFYTNSGTGQFIKGANI